MADSQHNPIPPEDDPGGPENMDMEPPLKLDGGRVMAWLMLLGAFLLALAAASALGWL